MNARALISRLSLSPHPEGGWYREIYRSPQRVTAPQGSRSALTSLYYLLERGQVSRWHVVDADEVWHFYAGGPLELLAFETGTATLRRRVLAAPTEAPQSEPVGIIPAGVWQAARTLGDYSLLGCSVAPGFEFADFRLVSDLPGHALHFAGALAGLRSLL